MKNPAKSSGSPNPSAVLVSGFRPNHPWNSFFRRLAGPLQRGITRPVAWAVQGVGSDPGPKIPGVRWRKVRYPSKQHRPSMFARFPALSSASSQDNAFAPPACKYALARLVTLMLFFCKPNHRRIHAASATAKHRQFGGGDDGVMVRVILNESLRWSAFSTAANSHHAS